VAGVGGSDVVVVTGAAGGIGSALRRRLEAAGRRVLGIDRHDAEVLLDLGDRAARADVATHVEAQLAGARLTGVVAAAGLLGIGGPAEAAADAVSVNHFGAVATLDALRPLLAGGGAAVAIGSHMAVTQPTSAVITEACLRGDEAGARAAALEEPALAYSSSKLALERWVRREAPTPAWIGAGVTLNAVALGLVDTAMTAASVPFILEHPDVMPIPAGRAATPDEAAALIAFLLSPDARFCCGSILSMDGGSEAVVRGEDWPDPKR
jgi:NAD(P)-dependent dehydrogenase (short-subunit alcohol dehydrogenase family)